MSAVLRAYGEHFDVNTFLVDCTLQVCAVKRRGEPVFPSSQSHGRRHDLSGVHVSVSDAEFSEFTRQVAEAIAFLRGKINRFVNCASGPAWRVCAWILVSSDEMGYRNSTTFQQN